MRSPGVPPVGGASLQALGLRDVDRDWARPLRDRRCGFAEGVSELVIDRVSAGAREVSSVRLRTVRPALRVENNRVAVAANQVTATVQDGAQRVRGLRRRQAGLGG